MAKKSRVEFVCQQCGAHFSKWSGRCTNCQAWNSLVEQASLNGATSSLQGKSLQTSSIATALKDDLPRLKSDIKDLDNVLGGGLTVGSVCLLAGQPGAGKSTLLLQLAEKFEGQGRVLYVSGEESSTQIATRAERLGLNAQQLNLAVSNSADDIAASIVNENYDLVIIDSIQTMKVAAVDSAAGSVSQITNTAHLLISAAKQTKTALLIVGHITKEGFIAGPKILEHLVDVVLQLETEASGLRVIRAHKNRYGPTTELAVFEMSATGMHLLENPSAFLLAERNYSDGSVILATLDGTRPLLVEVQALVNKSNFGYPKRTAAGFDLNRLNVLIAILSKRTKLSLDSSDVYVNIVGGLKIKDPGADLAVAMAIASAATGYELDSKAVVFGELGLGGEVRSVQQAERRIKEAKYLGFDYAIGPKTSRQSFIKPVSHIRDGLTKYLHQGKNS